MIVKASVMSSHASVSVSVFAMKTSAIPIQYSFILGFFSCFEVCNSNLFGMDVFIIDRLIGTTSRCSEKKIN